MILVTGAGGKTGKALVGSLARAGAQVRALVHRSEQREVLRSLGAEEVHVGDMLRPKVLDEATRGVESIYHICPNMSSDELAIGKKVIAAAQARGVRRIVYHSVLHPQVKKMPHHWAKLKVEEALFESGLDYVIFQPTAYMQNILAYWPAILSEGVYALPYNAQTRLSLVDLEDIAEAARRVLMTREYDGGTYELVGTMPLSQAEVAEIISKQIHRPVRFEMVSRSAWEQAARAQKMSEYAVQTLLRMFEYYEFYGMWGNPLALRLILGRNPTTLDEFIGKVVHSHRPDLKG